MSTPYVTIRNGEINIDNVSFSDENAAAEYLADSMISAGTTSFLNSSSCFYPDENGLPDFFFDDFVEKTMNLFEEKWLT